MLLVAYALYLVVLSAMLSHLKGYHQDEVRLEKMWSVVETKTWAAFFRKRERGLGKRIEEAAAKFGQVASGAKVWEDMRTSCGQLE